MTAGIIDGKQIAEGFRQEIAVAAADFQKLHGLKPHLAAILVGDDPASQVYVRNKERACEKAGLKSTLHRLPSTTSESDLLHLVQRLNAATDVHGILCQLPLPRHINPVTILDAIHPLKDVDAFHPENVGRLLQGRPRFLPCTPAGVMKMLEVSGVSLPGLHAVVIGRSDIVGKPMAALLMQRGADATVTVCHSRTQEIASITRQGDLLIAALGIAEFVKADMVKPGAIVIDVGINRVGERLVGDVDFSSVTQIAAAITPVPGGVGPMTIAMLLKNTLTAAELTVSSR
jgi:methylenetetrahydrofolate dehydrogenase (NADP+)/methenyltetrahydrofolate cyclohydrolase